MPESWARNSTFRRRSRRFGRRREWCWWGTGRARGMRREESRGALISPFWRRKARLRLRPRGRCSSMSPLMFASLGLFSGTSTLCRSTSKFERAFDEWNCLLRVIYNFATCIYILLHWGVFLPLSPLIRSKRTAEIIWGNRKEEILTDYDLREIDLYSFQVNFGIVILQYCTCIRHNIVSNRVWYCHIDGFSRVFWSTREKQNLVQLIVNGR